MIENVEASGPMKEETVLWFINNDVKALLRICKNESLSPPSRLQALATVGVHADRNTATAFADALIADSAPFVRAEAVALLATLVSPSYVVKALDHAYRPRD